MAKKKKATTKAVAVKKEANMDWVSAQSIASTGRDDLKAQGAYKMAMLASKVFEVPLQGITILGGQPYINKTGWEIKRFQKTPNAYFEKTWHHLAIPTEKYAILDVRLFNEKGKEIGSATGEATPENIKLAAVKLTLNMMAETRAKNRATSEALKGMVLTEAVRKMNEMVKKQQMTLQEAEIITEAARTSAEEINQPQTSVQPAPAQNYQPKSPSAQTQKSNVDYILQVKAKLMKLGAKTEKSALALLKNNTGFSWKNFNVSQVAAQRALAELLRK